MDYSMSIMREWRAEIRRALKDEYVAYVKTTGIAGYRQAPGNLGAVIATRDIDAERNDIGRACYYPEDDRC
jgi:hypothetical protein